VFKYYGPQLVFLTLVFLLFELTVAPLFQIKGVTPDLFLILLGFYSFYIYPNRTPHFAVFLGLVRELYSGTPLGFETIAYGISGLILWFLVIKIERESTLNQMFLIFILCFLNLLIVSVLNICLTETSLSFAASARGIVSISIYTTLLSPVFVWGLKRFLRLPRHDLFSRSH